MGLKLQKEYGWEFGSTRAVDGKEWPYIKPPPVGLSKDEAYARSLKPGQGSEAFINRIDAEKERQRQAQEFARNDQRGPVRRFAEGASRGARETLDTMAAGAGRLLKNVQELPGDVSLAYKNLTTSQAEQDRLASQEQPSVSAYQPGAGERMEDFYRKRAEEAQESQALRGQDVVSKAGHTVGGVAPYMIPGGGQTAFAVESGLGAYGQGQSLDKAILTGVMTVAGARGAGKLSAEFESLVAPKIAEDLAMAAKNPSLMNRVSDVTKRYIARVGGQAIGLPLIQAGTGGGVPTSPEEIAHTIAMAMGFGLHSAKAKENIKSLANHPETSPEVGEALNRLVDSEGQPQRPPVSAAAVDAFKINLPEGYLRAGDQYIFKGQGQRPVEPRAIPLEPQRPGVVRENEQGQPQPIAAGDLVSHPAFAKGEPLRVRSIEGDTINLELPRADGTTKPLTVRTDSRVGRQLQRVSPVDEAAHEAATSPYNDLAAPSDAQLEAGNYAKGKVRIAGLDISIENPVGSKRRAEWPALKSHYGYIRRAGAGADGEPLDVFVKPGTPEDYNGPVYILDQAKANGRFDEHKIMLGFDSEAAARKGYSDNYTKSWKVGPITEFGSPVEFREWLKTADTNQARRLE
jgi:hypothetical protein